MTFAAILASLIVAGDAGADAQTAPPPITEDSIAASSVNRGIEEPGRYAASNVFDGDAETVYCSAPRSGRAEVQVDLSDVDRARLRSATSVRITPSRTFSGMKVQIWLATRDPGSDGGYAEARIATTALDLALVKSTDAWA